MVKLNGGDCPKTKLKTKKNTIYSTEKTDKAPDIVCAAEENRVFGQPGGDSLLIRLSIAEGRPCYA